MKKRRIVFIAISFAIIIAFGITIYKLKNNEKDKIEEVPLKNDMISKNTNLELSFKEKIERIPKASFVKSSETACLAYLSLFYNGIHYKTPYWWSPQYNRLDDYGKIELINDLLGDEVTKTKYSLGDGFSEGNEEDYWEVDGAANLVAGTSIYQVNGYISEDIVMCLVESNSNVPNIMFFCRDDFEEIPLDKYKLNKENYINNVKEAHQVGAFDNNKDISVNIDSSIIDNLFKNIIKAREVSFEDHYELWEEKDDIKNAIDGMRGLRIITKDDIAINLEITNSGYVLIYNTWTAYKLEDKVWKDIWSKLPIENIRSYMDNQGYNYINGAYVPRSAPLDSPKIQEILNP